MTHDPIEPEDHDIPELFGRLESRVASPDPDAIRAEARRRGEARRRTLSMAGAFALIAVIAGGALWLTREAPSETATAADAKVGDRSITPPVARDSAPVEFDGLSGLQERGLPRLEWLRVTTIVPPDLPFALTVAPVSGHLWFDESVGEGELTFARPCSRATYWVLYGDDGFTVVDKRSETANLPSAPGDEIVRCVGPVNERRIDLFEKGDEVSYDAALDQYVVRGTNGQFSFTLGNTDSANLVFVPELTALRVDEAIAILENVGLRSDQTAQANRSLVVLSTDPPAGIAVASGSVVTIGTEKVDDVVWRPADTRIGGDSSPTVHRIDSGVLILNTENWGNDIVGEIWDDETGQARRIGETGLIWRHGPATVWTGTELLMVGGSNGPGIDRLAVAYDPERDEWRDLADPPIAAEGEQTVLGTGFWTGSAMVIPHASLAYDPAEDLWTSIAEWPFPVRQVAVIEGIEGGVIAWGGCEGPLCDETNTTLFDSGAMYSFSSDTWTTISDGPLPPAFHAVAEWTGAELVIVVTASGEGVAAAAFDPSTDSWRSLPKPPIPSRRESAMILTQDRLVLWGGQMNDGAIFRLAESDWQELPRAPLSGAFHTMVDLGSTIYVGGSHQSSPQLLELPNSRDLEYDECAKAKAFDPGGVQVIFIRGRAQFVKTGRDVPAEVHLPCLALIGGPEGDLVSGSSHSQTISELHGLPGN